jgi:hypothetical protein
VLPARLREFGVPRPFYFCCTPSFFREDVCGYAPRRRAPKDAASSSVSAAGGGGSSGGGGGDGFLSSLLSQPQRWLGAEQRRRGAEPSLVERADSSFFEEPDANLRAKEAAGRIAVILGWYNAAGYRAQAVGALGSGLAVARAQAAFGWSPLESYRLVFYSYGAVGGLMGLLYLTISPTAEARKKPAAAAAATGGGDEPKACCPSWLAPLLPNANFGLRRPESAYIVARLCVLFAMDSFAGAFVMQTWIAFWFDRRWGFSSELVGYLLMASNVVAGASGVAAAYFVKRYGPMLTMVASHFPSNLLLLAVPFMPTGWAAAAMLVARFCISQMDVPARQAYVVMVVASDERSAANGITNVIRSLGMAAAPSIVGYLSSQSVDTGPLGGLTLFGSPWLIAGVIKCVYDMTLYGLYLTDTVMNKGVENAALKDDHERKADAGLAAAAASAAAAKAAEAAEAGEGRDKGLGAPLLAR